MALSRLPRCPVCHVGVSLRLVWDMAPKDRFGLLREATGLTCPSCGTRLKIGQTWSAVVIVAAPFVIIALSYVADKVFLLGDPARLVGAACLLALFVFSSRVTRVFATLRVREGIATVDFPVERLRKQLIEPELKGLEEQDLAAAESTDQRVCRYCGKSTAASSRACLHCGTYDANAI